MKAILPVLLVGIALLSLVACGDGEEAAPTGTRPAVSPTAIRTALPEQTKVASPVTQPVASPTVTATAPAEQTHVTEPGTQQPLASPTAVGQAEVAPTQPAPSPPEPEEAGEVARSEKPRVTSPAVPASDLAELAAGNSAFAFDLYQAVSDSGGNLFFSPYSISLALAMTYAGAAGETKQQMAETVSFTLPADRLHPAFNALDLELASRGEGGGAAQAERFQLNIANAIWGQQGYAFLPEFLDVLAQNYGAGLRLLDFVGTPEESRVTINDWVSEQTEGKIQDLVPQGAIDELTRLVLTNAIYFNAGWAFPFEPENTRDGPFHLLDGGEVTVPMMKQRAELLYAEGEGYQAVSLPYGQSGLSMVLMVPPAGQFEAFENSLNAERVNAIVKPLGRWDVALTMPRFDFESSVDLGETLAAMGMPDAFSAQLADFSGMDGSLKLLISAVVHKAFVSVDEEGTEAAAATAVIVGETSAPEPAEPVELIIDRPFIFLIRDYETGAILFLGRVLNPAA
jgi:serpin B